MNFESHKCQTQFLNKLIQTLMRFNKKIFIFNVIKMNLFFVVDSFKSNSVLMYNKWMNYLFSMIFFLFFHKKKIEFKFDFLKFTFVETRKIKIWSQKYVKIKYTASWNDYDKKYEFNNDDFVTIAIKKSFSCKIIIIKTFNQTNLNEKLFMLQNLQHKRFNFLLNFFDFEQAIYVIFYYISIFFV